MFGWEFPPNNQGGLGTACFGLTKGLHKNGMDVTFVLPKKNSNHDHVNIIITDNLYIGNEKIKIKQVDSLLYGYATQEEYSTKYSEYSKMMQGKSDNGELYGENLFEEVTRYAQKAKIIADFEDFDIIHCHDWMTYKAGIKAKEHSNKPLVIHVHATDFDRTGGSPNQTVYEIEREGMHAADNIIAVSNYTKSMIVKHYGIEPDKVTVVHNGVDFVQKDYDVFKSDEKIVLFLGRLTIQKGPDYFIETAKKVLEVMPDVKFVVAGTGDMYSKMIRLATDYGIGKNIMFTGHLKGSDVNKAYQMADLYVMPSISEPFGITPLEALKNNTPVLISKTSGVSEVLANALKVDFWDTDEMTNKIVSVLNYSNLHKTLTEHGKLDVKKLNWDVAAKKCINVYSNTLGGAQ